MNGQQADGPGIVAGDPFRIVLITAPDEEIGARLARGLVEEQLAACVNRRGGWSSTYRWEGRVEEAEEVLLVVKTRASRLEALVRWLRRAHPYDVPECVALEPKAVEGAYAAWWGECC